MKIEDLGRPFQLMDEPYPEGAPGDYAVCYVQNKVGERQVFIPADDKEDAEQLLSQAYKLDDMRYQTLKNSERRGQRSPVAWIACCIQGSEWTEYDNQGSAEYWGERR